jgi:hypothetical protein
MTVTMAQKRGNSPRVRAIMTVIVNVDGRRTGGGATTRRTRAADVGEIQNSL